MLLIPALLLPLAAVAAFFLWRFRSRLTGQPEPAGRQELSAGGTEERPNLSLPAQVQDDLLEIEDVRWLLERRRGELEQEHQLQLQRGEQAARIDALTDNLDALEARIGQLQQRAMAWQQDCMALEEQRTCCRQLEAALNRQGIRLEAALREQDRLQQELDAAREEAASAIKSREAAIRQLALLKELVR